MRGIGQVSHRDWMERRFLSAWQTDEPMRHDLEAGLAEAAKGAGISLDELA